MWCRFFKLLTLHLKPPLIAWFIFGQEKKSHYLGVRAISNWVRVSVSCSQLCCCQPFWYLPCLPWLPWLPCYPGSLVVASLWLSKWRTGHAKVNTKCVNTMRHGQASELTDRWVCVSGECVSGVCVCIGNITILLGSPADSRCWHCNYHCDTICCLA